MNVPPHVDDLPDIIQSHEPEFSLLHMISRARHCDVGNLFCFDRVIGGGVEATSMLPRLNLVDQLRIHYGSRFLAFRSSVIPWDLLHWTGEQFTNFSVCILVS